MVKQILIKKEKVNLSFEENLMREKYFYVKKKVGENSYLSNQ